VRRAAQQSGSEMFLELELRFFMNLMTDGNRFFLVLIDSAANLGVYIHGGEVSPY